ncbi:hypothetical protein [Mesorhizobium sp. M0306]|uniref:hypothetical protein n=1 Tax=unclassified Mesorhizobium TaxID=325217 RepID=UPI003335AC7D
MTEQVAIQTDFARRLSAGMGPLARELTAGVKHCPPALRSPPQCDRRPSDEPHVTSMDQAATKYAQNHANYIDLEESYIGYRSMSFVSFYRDIILRQYSNAEKVFWQPAQPKYE